MDRAAGGRAPSPRPLPAEARLNWRAAALLGLVTSTFSTLVSQLLAARIGRDAVVDWMVVAAIPLRGPALQADPDRWVILAGVLFHQWADFSWAIVFFGLLGRWTAGLNPWTILLVGAPWAVFTSALEWLFLVPVLPFWQPVFTLTQVYWIGLLVHLTSASLYPLFPWLRDRLAGRTPAPRDRRFARIWGGLAVAGLCVLAALALFGRQGREPPHAGGNPAFDQGYMRRMAAHHAQGVELALLAAERAQDAHLRALARLMAAEQKGEIAVFERWWRGWFGGALPPAAAEDHAAMPGMVPAEEVEALRQAPADDAFDARFVAAMTSHHRGAVAMADEALRRAGDLRLRLMSHAIRHEQRGEIELMRGAGGFAAVGAAVSNMLCPPARPPRTGPPGWTPRRRWAASAPCAPQAQHQRKEARRDGPGILHRGLLALLPPAAPPPAEPAPAPRRHPGRLRAAGQGRSAALPLAALLLVPVPLSNVPPGLVLALIACAALERNGLLLGLGLSAALLLLSLTSALAWGRPAPSRAFCGSAGTAIAAVAEAPGGVLRSDGVEGRAECLVQRVHGPGRDAAQFGLHLGPDRLDRAQIR